MKLETVLSRKQRNLALVIGNGINRHNNFDGGRSWSELLNNLHSSPHNTNTNIPKLLSLTELYDLLELQQNSKPSPEQSLQKKFSNLMQEWQPGEHHIKIVSWSKSNNIPILTTNFENTLGKAIQCDEPRNVDSGKFTDFYPWSKYYSSNEIVDPARDFAIWHINGMQKHHRSIRLGLGHYMGSVARARAWIYGGKEDSLFYGKNQSGWKGSKSWLHCIFNNDLLIFGLELGAQEVFLRWLLIERAKYFKKFPDRKRKAWFVETKNPAKQDLWKAKKYFLEGVGITPIETESYSEIYNSDHWNIL